MSTLYKVGTTAWTWLLFVALLGVSSAQAGPLDLFNRKLKQSARYLRGVQARRLPVKIQRSYARFLSAENLKRLGSPRTLGNGGPGTVKLERSALRDTLGVTIIRPNRDIRSIYRGYRVPGPGEKRATLQYQTVTYGNGLMVQTTFGRQGKHQFHLKGDRYDAIHHSQPRLGRSGRPRKPDLFQARRITNPSARSTALVGAGGLTMLGGVALGGTPAGPILLVGGALAGSAGLLDNKHH